jgi:hypothetical protein
MVIQLSGGSRATVSIGGSSGIKSSTPVSVYNPPAVSRPAVAAPSGVSYVTQTRLVPTPTASVSSAQQTLIDRNPSLKPLTTVKTPTPIPSVVVNKTLQTAVQVSNARTNLTLQENLSPVSVKPIAIQLSSVPGVVEPVKPPAPTVTQTLAAILAESKASAPKITTIPTNSLLNTPTVTIPTLSPTINDTVKKIVDVANKASATIAGRTDLNWVNGAKIADNEDVTAKINSIVAKALSGQNASENFNQLIAPQLSSLSTLSKARINTITTKSVATNEVNNITAINAIKSISNLVTSGMKKAASTSDARNLKTVASVANDNVINMKIASDATVKNDHEALISKLSSIVKNGATAAANARIEAGKTKLGIMSVGGTESMNIPGFDLVNPTPLEKTIQDIKKSSGKSDAIPAANPPGSITNDKTKAPSKPSTTKKAEPETQAQKDARTKAEAQAAGALDFDNTGSIGNDVISSKSTIKNAISIKSSTGTIVKVDPDVYTSLKATGWSDTQMATAMASGKMGIVPQTLGSGAGVNAGKETGKITLDLKSYRPDAVIDKSLFYVEPTVVKNSNNIPTAVPEWALAKAKFIGLTEAETADLGTKVLEKIATAPVASVPVADFGEPGSLITEAKTALLPYEERMVQAGLGKIVPLTAAQKQAAESQDTSIIGKTVSYLGNLFGKVNRPEYPNGYELQDTVEGILAKDMILKQLTAPGVSLRNIPSVGGVTSYEIFSDAIKSASASDLDKIAKSNPRVLLGASTDTQLRNKISQELGDKFEPVIQSAMSKTELEQYNRDLNSNNPDLRFNINTFENMEDFGNAHSIDAISLFYDAVTLSPGANLVLAGLIPMKPVTTTGKLAAKALELTREGKILENGIEVGKASIDPATSKIKATIGKETFDIESDLSRTPKTKTISSESTKFETPKATLEMGPDGKIKVKQSTSTVTPTKSISETTAASLKQLEESIAKDVAKYGSSPTEYKPLTANDIQLTEDLGQGVYRGADGQKYINYGSKTNPRFLSVAEDYDPNVKGILSVQEVDETGHASVVKLTSSVNEADNVFHVSWADPESGLKGTVSVKAPTATLTDEIKQAAAQSDYETKIASNGAEPTLASEEAEWAARAEDMYGEGSGGMGGEGSGGMGGSEGYSGGTTTGATDYSTWTMNSDWGAEIRSLDGGKTWEVKDPETSAIMSTKEYESLLTTRNEARRAKYDATTNTYTKLTKNPTTGLYDVTMYQDSAGGWVTKAQLDAERAAIALNNPTFTYGVDSSMNNARIRTNDATKAVQYMDPQTGNWLEKDVYVKLIGSAETPIWNPEGYYYFKNSDGTFSILNPYTNVRQTPDEYAAYLAARNTPTPTQVSTYQTPSDYSSYVPNLQYAYDNSVAQVATRTGGAEQTLSAWDQFVQTSDFDRIIKSESDTQILVKAKNGESLTEAEISRAQFLRSQMSPEGQAAFDAATGGETSANLMPMNDFENMVTGNRDAISQMSDSEIKLSGLPPEKEIIVHQTKAEENIGKLLAMDEYTTIPDESKNIIQAELGYYAGEPSTISNLLNKFNSLKGSWTLQATQTWDKIVEALKSAKSLISEMPTWWTSQNSDYGLAELVLGNNKYSDILISTPKSPTSSTMETAFAKSFNSGVFTAGSDGALAVEYTYKKLPGWIVKSPEGSISFIRKSDLITTADEAINFAVKPIDMYFWEKPTNVQTQFQIPADADGSKVISITKADPYAASEAEWSGLTSSGGLTSDMTQEFVKIDLMTPSGLVWSTVREASKSGAFQLGKTVNVIERDAIRVVGLAGTDIQALGADEFRTFIESNANEIRNLSGDDLPYLTKYLDESRSNMIDNLRSSPEESIQTEIIPEPAVQEIPQTISETISPTTLASEYSEAAAKLEATRSNIINSADEVAKLSDDYATASAKASADPKNKALAAEKVAAKGRLTAAESKLKAYNKAQWDDLAISKAKASNIRTGTGKINELLTELNNLPVSEGKKAFENLISKDEALIETIQNMSRSEAEDLASKIASKLGSDRSQAEKIMGLNYQGAANRITDSTITKMTRSDQELISKAKTRALSQTDYQQMERIFDNAKAYEGISVSSDLGRMKINSILDSSIADKTSELRKLLSDTDVKTALKDEKFADEAFNKVYDINPDVATQFQKAAQDAIIASVKSDPKFANLSKGAKDFVDQLYTKRIYTIEDMEKLAEIQATLPRSTFSRFIRGTVIGSAGKAAKWVATHKLRAVTGVVATYLAVNGAFFIYFAAEEGTQSLIQMVGFNSPIDQFAKQMNETGLPAMNKINDMLAPFDWALENIPGFSMLFPAAIGFKWYMDYAANAQIKDKLGKITNAGLWIPDVGCTQGPGCWGKIRPESEWPAYFAANPDKVQYWDADFTGRVYDIQPDGSIGPNNMIAQGLGITDPALAVQVGLGHMQAAANQGAKKILTDDFSAAYAQVVKGGATSEMALQAYTKALTAKDGTLPPTGASPGTALTGLNSDQTATIAVAPTTMDALTRYATFGGTQPGDAQVWRSAFIKPDGSLDAAKLKTAYPDMTAAQMKALFPAEAINKMVAADLATISDPEQLAKKINKYKANGMVDSGARIEQFMPAAQAAAFTARQNDPSKFKLTASGNTVSWIDDTGYPHTSSIIQSGKLLNPVTGQYDINQKKSSEGGAEYTLDTGKYAEYINSGGKDITGFLSKEDNWACTYNCSSTGSKSGGSGSGYSSKSGGSSYSKSTGQTGIFIDTAGLGAEVYENGAKIGDTDVIIEVEAGVHTVTIQKSGYKSYTIPVQVYAGSIARKSVTLYPSSGTTLTKAEQFINAVGGDNALNPDHIVYAYAISQSDNALATAAKAAASPTITGTWTFTAIDVLNLITAYGGV